MGLLDTIDAYGASWNEPDAAARLRLLEQSWADDGMYVDPTVELSGREALVAHIGGTREVFGDFRIDRTSGLDEHHGYARFSWTMRGADGQTLTDGFDVVRLAPDGRLGLVVGFFGPFPPG